jgi:high-affinity Fe2+/Pb2+ permease
MYDGIRAYGGIRNPGAAIAIAYFIVLVIVGNCILLMLRRRGSLTTLKLNLLLKKPVVDYNSCITPVF